VLNKRVAWLISACGLYFAFWAMLEFGLFGVSPGGSTHAARVAVDAAAYALPSVALGAVVARWWAPALTLVFVAGPLFPEHCVTNKPSYDVVSIGCSGIALADLPMLIAFAASMILVGVAVARFALWLIRRPGTSGGAGLMLAMDRSPHA
jgi:hypothetical protein